MRLVLRLGDRTAHPLAAGAGCCWYARRRGLGAGAAWRLYRDCIATGGTPLDVDLWRGLHGGRNPLPQRAASLLLPRLGDPAAHALLADKMAAAARLTAAGAVFPATPVVLSQGQSVDPDRLVPVAAAGAGLFVKPRHGHGGAGAFGLRHDGGGWQIDARPVDATALAARLNRLLGADDLLVQEHLAPCTALADLATADRAPVLRLATARRPDEAPFLQSALLTVPVPDRHPRDFLHGGIQVPVDPASGRLAAGILLGAPRRPIPRLPWNNARLAGCTLPGFEDAVAMALGAMTALPGLALVHWDLIPSTCGMVMLEGNTGGNWILATLPGAFGLETASLPPLLRAWLPA